MCPHSSGVLVRTVRAHERSFLPTLAVLMMEGGDSEVLYILMYGVAQGLSTHEGKKVNAMRFLQMFSHCMRASGHKQGPVVTSHSKNRDCVPPPPHFSE